LQKKLQQSYIILPVSEKFPVIFHFPHFLTALLQIQYCLPDLRGIALSLLQFINIKKVETSLQVWKIYGIIILIVH